MYLDRHPRYKGAPLSALRIRRTTLLSGGGRRRMSSAMTAGLCEGLMRTGEMKVLRDRKADIGISVNPNRETVLSYFANEEALGFELVSGAVSKHTGLRTNVVLGDACKALFLWESVS